MLKSQYEKIKSDHKLLVLKILMEGLSLQEYVKMHELRNAIITAYGKLSLSQCIDTVKRLKVLGLEVMRGNKKSKHEMKCILDHLKNGDYEYEALDD